MRPPSMVAGIASLVVSTACGNGGVRGGTIVDPSAAPRTNTRSVFERARCEDGSGAPSLLNREVRAAVVSHDGRLLLVETRPGYETLVIHNALRSGDRLVFQAILDADSGPLLYDFQLPERGSELGFVALVRQFETHSVPGGFHARWTQPVAACRLVPVISEPGDAGIDKPSSAR